MVGLLNIVCFMQPARGAPNPPPQIEIKEKNIGFAETMTSEVLPHLPFSRSQPLKSADENTLEFRAIN
jgi:hypothetical protein